MTEEPPRLTDFVARADPAPERDRLVPANRTDVEGRNDPDRERERRVLSLHDRRGQDLYGFALGLGLLDDEAADAVQETMLRLWRELESGKDVHDLDAWAFRTAYHLAIDQHRLRRRLAGSLGRLVARGGDFAADPADSADSAALWQAVDGLPERQRAVLYLRYRADLPFDRVGFVLGITSSAARSHASNALATLRRRLGQEES
jgi:RNA polymerase sigma-70 factor (ECF subfamily)